VTDATGVRLRLFARARETAGTADATFAAGGTLGSLLLEAQDRYGAEFSAVLASSRVWINGDEPAHGDDTVLARGDEVAVLPPVSGGS
jgi:molybdopterin converting factor small subunit